jgi:hypothetical protein
MKSAVTQKEQLKQKNRPLAMGRLKKSQPIRDF